MFCSPGELVVLCPVCWCAMCRGRAAEVWFLRGGQAPPSLQVTSSALVLFCFVLAPGLGQPKLRGIKTNAQPAPATSPCRSAHLLFVFLGEEMVGCHVSVSSHVMPLPALVHSLGHNLPLTFGGSSQAQKANSEGPWESLAHPAHWFSAAKQARQAHLQV